MSEDQRKWLDERLRRLEQGMDEMPRQAREDLTWAIARIRELEADRERLRDEVAKLRRPIGFVPTPPEEWPDRVWVDEGGWGVRSSPAIGVGVLDYVGAPSHMESLGYSPSAKTIFGRWFTRKPAPAAADGEGAKEQKH